jgi:hypothetical protein
MVVVIYPPTNDWERIKQRPQQLMEQFARDGHEVYYCNRTQEIGRPFSQPIPNLSIVHDNKAFIRKLIPELKRQKKTIMVWTNRSKLYLFLEQYFADTIVYDYWDSIPNRAPYFRKMLQRADISFAASQTLKEEIEEEDPLLRCDLVPNGTDLGPDSSEGLDFPANDTWRHRYVSIREALADQFPELFVNADFAPAHTSELSLLLDRVQQKIKLAAEAEPYLLTTYLRNLEKTLTSLLQANAVELLHTLENRTVH